MQKFVFLLIAALLLGCGFFVISAGLEQDSLWADEGWTLWAVREPGWRGTLSTLQRVAADVHPPLYFLLMDVWIGIAGESVYVLRLFSALCALLALAATAAVGRRVFNARIGLIAAALLATAPFVVYYGREARMYALLLALTVLSTWAYVGTTIEGENRKSLTQCRREAAPRGENGGRRVRHLRALPRRVVSAGNLYILFSAALVYTHYAGWLILIAHGLHRLLTRRRVFAWLLRAGVIGVLFAPWGFVWLRQIRASGVPAATPLPTNLDTLNILLLVLTNGLPLLFAVPFVLALLKKEKHNAEPRRGRVTEGEAKNLTQGHGQPEAVHTKVQRNAPLRFRLFSFFSVSSAPLWINFSLLLIWLILPPVVLLLLNAFRPPLFQIRYVIGALPAGALLVAWALEQGLKTQKLNTEQEEKDLTQRLKASKAQGEKVETWRAMSLQGNALRFSAFFAPLRLKMLSQLISLFLFLAMLWLHLTQYGLYWPAKPRWNQAAAQYGAARDALHPAITIIPPQSPLAYYDAQFGLRRGITLDLAWRWHEPDEMRALVETLSNAGSIWLVSPANDARTWDTAALLINDGWQIGYRDSVMATIFYRFDRTQNSGAQNDAANFNFRFTAGGADPPLFAYTGGLGEQLYARRGEPFCFDLALAKQLEDRQPYHLQIQLTQGQGTLRAGADVPLEALSAAPFSACVPMPADAPAGTYHLRIAIVNSASDQRFYLVEGANALYWGDQLLIGWVSVE